MKRSVWMLPRPRFVVVLVSLLLILVLTPLVQVVARPGMSRMLGLLGLIVPVLGVTAAGDVGRARRIGIGLAVATIIASADVVAHVSPLPSQAGVTVALLFLGYTTVRLLAGVVRTHEVTGDVIAGALASYMMVGLTWAIGYGLIETLWPGSIHGLSEGNSALEFPDLLYFSYITLLTIGYGDVTPVSDVARMMAVVEGLIGMTFTTIILAVLVAAHLHRSDRHGPGGR